MIDKITITRDEKGYYEIRIRNNHGCELVTWETTPGAVIETIKDKFIVEDEFDVLVKDIKKTKENK